VQTETEALAGEYLEELEFLLKKLAGPQRTWLDWGQTLGGAYWHVRDQCAPRPLELPGVFTARDRDLVERRFLPAELTPIEIGYAYKRLRRFLADEYAAYWCSPRFQGQGNGGTFSIGPHEMKIRPQKNAVLAALLSALQQADWPETFGYSKIQQERQWSKRRYAALSLRPCLSRFLAEQRQEGFDPVLRLSVVANTGEINLSVEPAAELQSAKGNRHKSQRNR
jgi:hypothetical protein